MLGSKVLEQPKVGNITREKQTKRNSNIELLRIICMIFIIIHHTFVHSKFQTTNSVNFNILYLIQVFGRISNNIFIIIVGYYMVNKSIKKKSILKIVFEAISYSYSILAIYLIFSPEKNIYLIISSIIPILSDAEWFVTAYILLYLSIPFINILIKNMSKEQFKKLLILLIICFSILPTVLLLRAYYSNYIWFICLYLVGAYLRLYGIDEISNKNGLIFVISSISILLLAGFKKLFETNIINISALNNFISFILSVSVFIAFAKKKPYYNKGINYVASSVLGIYLLHDNNISRLFIWDKFNISAVIDKKYFWIYEISIVLIIFCFGLVIDKIREKFIEKPIFKYMESRQATKKTIKQKC